LGIDLNSSSSYFVLNYYTWTFRCGWNALRTCFIGRVCVTHKCLSPTVVKYWLIYICLLIYIFRRLMNMREDRNCTGAFCPSRSFGEKKDDMPCTCSFAKYNIYLKADML
jgi:hypothetical protein